MKKLSQSGVEGMKESKSGEREGDGDVGQARRKDQEQISIVARIGDSTNWTESFLYVVLYIKHFTAFCGVFLGHHVDPSAPFPTHFGVELLT